MTALPKLEAQTGAQRALAALSIVAASVLLIWNATDVFTNLDGFRWWTPLAFLAGVAAADFLSGVVHWAADTWGRDDTPIVGPRLLIPFRVHHVNPDDFLTRSFLDTNGDVALIAVLVFCVARLIPIDTTWGGPLAVACLGFAGVGGMTNQIHQWAHMPSP
ncbi:MAG: fatty acid desaturase CarF family protein, partial [Vicinamibacterales bacterium]